MKLGRMAHKLRISSDSIILIKEGTEMAKMENLRGMIATIESHTDLKNIIIMVVADFSDISVIDEKSMNAHGWFRAETLRKLIHTDNGHDDPPPEDEDKGSAEIDV